MDQLLLALQGIKDTALLMFPILLILLCGLYIALAIFSMRSKS